MSSPTVSIKQETFTVDLSAKKLLANRRQAMTAMLDTLRSAVEQKIRSDHGRWATPVTTRFGSALDALGVHVQPQGWGGSVTIRKNNLPLLDWLNYGTVRRYTKKPKKMYRGFLTPHPFFRQILEANEERAKNAATQILQQINEL